MSHASIAHRKFTRLKLGLLVVALSTSAVLVACGPLFGREVDLVEPRRLALHPDGTRAWVLDHALDAVVEVDLDTGRAHIVSDAERGRGVEFDFPYGMRPSIAFDPSRARLLVATTSGIIAVNIWTGRRTVVVPGEGTLLDENGWFAPQSLALVGDDGDTALVTSIGDMTLYEVDLATGEREPVSRTGIGEGDDVSMQGTVAYDAAHDRAILWTIVYTYQFPALYTIDLETGDRDLAYIRELCASGESGICDHPDTDMAISPDGETAWLTKNYGVWAIDIETGAETLVSGGLNFDDLVGEGPLLLASTGIAYDPVHDRLVVTGYDYGIDPVVRGRYVATIDLATGDRTIVHPVVDDEPESMP